MLLLMMMMMLLVLMLLLLMLLMFLAFFLFSFFLFLLLFMILIDKALESFWKRTTPITQTDLRFHILSIKPCWKYLQKANITYVWLENLFFTLNISIGWSGAFTCFWTCFKDLDQKLFWIWSKMILKSYCPQPLIWNTVSVGQPLWRMYCHTWTLKVSESLTLTHHHGDEDEDDDSQDDNEHLAAQSDKVSPSHPQTTREKTSVNPSP